MRDFSEVKNEYKATLLSKQFVNSDFKISLINPGRTATKYITDNDMRILIVLKSVGLPCVVISERCFIDLINEIIMIMVQIKIRAVGMKVCIGILTKESYFSQNASPRVVSIRFKQTPEPPGSEK